MNQAQAQHTVAAVALVVAAVVAHDGFRKTGKATPPFKSVVSFAMILSVLAIGAEVAPQIAGPFALLVGIAIILPRLPKGATK